MPCGVPLARKPLWNIFIGVENYVKYSWMCFIFVTQLMIRDRDYLLPPLESNYHTFESFLLKVSPFWCGNSGLNLYLLSSVDLPYIQVFCDGQSNIWFRTFRLSLFSELDTLIFSSTATVLLTLCLPNVLILTVTILKIWIIVIIMYYLWIKY